MALKTLQAHKLRTFLTTLGVIIGVSAVLVNVSALEGFDAFFQGEVQSLGANFINIQAGETTQGVGTGAQEIVFDDEIYEKLKDIPRSEASASKNDVGTVTYNEQSTRTLIMGVDTNYFDVSGQEVIHGYGLRGGGGKEVVLTESFATETFNEVIAPPSTIEIEFGLDIGPSVSHEFDVVGIVEGPGSFGEFAPGVYIPVSTFNNISNEEGYSTIQLFADSPEDIQYVKNEASDELDLSLDVEPSRTFEISEEKEEDSKEGEDSSILGVGGEEAAGVAEGKDEYTIVTQEAILDFTNNILGTINLVAIGVASISLVVGGIGIANIMLVTVSERTREIGVMKAVGATNIDVLGLFILESGIIGMIGGIIGLIVGALISKVAIPAFLGIQGIVPLSWVGISIGVSFVVGVLSGFYPAFRASQMDPVEALSYE